MSRVMTLDLHFYNYYYYDRSLFFQLFTCF